MGVDMSKTHNAVEFFQGPRQELGGRRGPRKRMAANGQAKWAETNAGG